MDDLHKPPNMGNTLHHQRMITLLPLFPQESSTVHSTSILVYSKSNLI